MKLTQAVTSMQRCYNVKSLVLPVCSSELRWYVHAKVWSRKKFAIASSYMIICGKIEGKSIYLLQLLEQNYLLCNKYVM